MERRTLGRSGVEVPVIGFGCGGSARLMVGDDRAAQDAAVAEALSSGIDYFDTAPAYGASRSETNLGRALADAGASGAIVSTKFVVGPEELDDCRGAVLRSMEQSLRRLRRDRVDMLIMHNRVAVHRPEGERIGVGPVLGLDDVVGPAGVLAACQELQASGTIRACGLTALGGEPQAVAEVLATGIPGVINAAFSPLQPTAGLAVPAFIEGEDHAQVIDRANSHDMGTLAIRVFGSGRLLDVAPADSPLVEQLRQLARRLGGGDAIAGCVRFALAKPGVACAILGFSEAAHVRAAVSAAAGHPMSPAELDQAGEELESVAASAM